MGRQYVQSGSTALYERLSKDDELQGESNSISNQRMYLEEYARSHGFHNIRHFVDDGYTGKNFNRPGFQEMLAEIEKGNIETVIVKDMSRFGRNYLEVGFYTEIFFPKKDVRFIAVNNSVDSANPADNDFTPFLNIMNEWYVKDISNKIRTIFNAKMKDGQRVSGSIPYGYNRRPEDKQTLVVDPEASKVVRRIFELAAEKNGPTEIAKILTEERVLIPSAYTLCYHPEQSNRRAAPDNCNWNSCTISQILGRREYLGHTILRKSISTNFKTDSRRAATEEEMLVFPNTHEPIIDQELWDAAQKGRKRTRTRKEGRVKYPSRYSGILFCAECGSRMSYENHLLKNGLKVFNYCCGGYCRNTHNCTAHYLPEKALDQLVLHSIQRIAAHVIEDEEAFAEELQRQWKERTGGKAQKTRDEINRVQKRLGELDSLITSLYENYVSGILPERQYRSLVNKYDEEQQRLDTRIRDLQEELQEIEKQPLRTEKFIPLIRKYKNPSELSDQMLLELVDTIMVHESTGTRPHRQMHIDIYFNFIGQFDLAYTEEELAALEQKKLEAEREKKERKLAAQRIRNTIHRKELQAARWMTNEGHKYAKRVCEWCGKEYWPTGNRQRYCTKDCWKEAGRTDLQSRRYEEKGTHTFLQKNCMVCGKPFWPVNGREKMCSEGCRRSHIRDRQNIYYHAVRAEKEKARRNEVRQKTMDENGGHLYSQRKCEFCGTSFWPTKPTQLYCCKVCANRAAQKRIRERLKERRLS